MRSFSKAAAIIFLAAATVVSVTACSSGDSSGSSTASGGNGKTVKIMVFGSFSQPPFPLKQIDTAAQAAVKQVNADGGINGTQIELISCDDNGSANGSTACGRQAVQENVAAVVGAFTLFGDNIVPQLEAANIPYILPVAISGKEVSSTVSFPIMASATPIAADLYALKQANSCNTIVGAASQNAQSQASYENYEVPVAKNLGLTTDTVFYPPTTTDFSSVAAQVTAKGDCVVYQGGAQDTAAIVTAIGQSGVKMTQVAISTIALPTQTLSQLGTTGDGVLVYAPMYYPSTNKPQVTQAVTNMQAVDSGVIIDDTALNSYAAVLTFADAAMKLTGDITGQALVTELNTPGTTIDTGMYAPTDFAKDAGFFPPAPRVAGATYLPYISKNGQWETNGDPIQLAGNLGF
ncbi:MAG: hypothetical protein JWQ19_1773 [Subtercola sp.]|nr:hypothetical protein [Subtercola sp.]